MNEKVLKISSIREESVGEHFKLPFGMFQLMHFLFLKIKYRFCYG